MCAVCPGRRHIERTGMNKVHHSGSRGGQNLELVRDASLAWSGQEKLDKEPGTDGGLCEGQLRPSR